MGPTSKGLLHDLPYEAAAEIWDRLDERTVYGVLPQVSKSLRAAAAGIHLVSATFALQHSHAVAKFAAWLGVHGAYVTQLHLVAPSLHDPEAKRVLWTALSTPGLTKCLQELRLEMPLTPEDEAAVITTIAPSAPKLATLQVHYKRPLSHTKNYNVMCFCTHFSPFLWLAAAHVRDLTICGACVCNTRSIAQVTGLTRLEIGCCNTAAPDDEFSRLVRSLPKLQHLVYTSSKPVVVTVELMRSLAAYSSITHLELHNFSATSSDFGTAQQLGSALMPPAMAAATTAAAAYGPLPASLLSELMTGLQQLQVLKLFDYSGLLARLPLLVTVPKLTELTLTRSRQDSFMPAFLADMFSDSDSSDSDSSEDAADSNSHSGSEAGFDSGSDLDDISTGGSAGGSPDSSAGVLSNNPFASASGRPAACKLAACSSRSITCRARNSSCKRNPLAYLAALHWLEELDLSGFGLRSIAPLCPLSKLRVLKLGPAYGAEGGSRRTNQLNGCGIAGVEALQSLQHLDLSYNQLQHSSLSILADLTCLTLLNLAANALDSSSSSSGGCRPSGCSKAAGSDQHARCLAGQSSGSALAASQCSNASATQACCLPAINSNTIVGEAAIDALTALRFSSEDLDNMPLRAQPLLDTLQLWQPVVAAGDGAVACNIGFSNSGCCGKVKCGLAALAPLAASMHCLDISGCGFADVPSLTAFTALTCLRAGTAFENMGRKGMLRCTNSLSGSSVAALSRLTKLQELQLAGSVPAASYSGFTALKQLTKLILQDYNAADGLFVQPQQQQAQFPHLEELGLMMGCHQAAAAMGQLQRSCRGLRRLTVFANTTANHTEHWSGCAQRGCLVSSRAAAGCCGDGSHQSAEGASSFQPAAEQSPSAAAGMAGAQVTSGCCRKAACSPVAGAHSSGTPAANSTAALPIGSKCSSLLVTNGCCPTNSLKSSACASSAIACRWHSSLCGLTALTRLDLPAPKHMAALTGLTNLRYLQLLAPPDMNSSNTAPCNPVPAVSAANTGCNQTAGCWPAGLSGSCGSQQQQSTACVAAVPAQQLGACGSNKPVACCDSVANCVSAVELFELRALTRLSVLDLKQVCVSRNAVDTLQHQLPCTRVQAAGAAFSCC